MPRTPITRLQLRAWVAITAVVVLAIVAVLVGVVIAQGVEMNDRLVDSQRAGCERTRQDRVDLATFMRSAAAARAASGDDEVAAEYALLAESVESRIVDCAQAFPR